MAAGGDYEFGAAATDRVLAELEPRFNTWLRKLAELTAEQACNPSENVDTRMVCHRASLTVTIPGRPNLLFSVGFHASEFHLSPGSGRLGTISRAK